MYYYLHRQTQVSGSGKTRFEYLKNFYLGVFLAPVKTPYETVSHYVLHLLRTVVPTTGATREVVDVVDVVDADASVWVIR